MKIKNLLIIASLLNCVSLNGYTFKLNVVENNTKQHLIQACDAHYGCGTTDPEYDHPTMTNAEIAKINKKQANDIITFAKIYPLEDCLFIVEDLYTYTGKDKDIKKNFDDARIENEKVNFTNLMSYVSDLCDENKIDIVNIEFRQANTLFLDTLDITTNELLREFNEIIDEIKKYDDCDFLNNYYSKTIDRVLLNNKTFINILKNNKNKYYDQIKKQITEKDLDQFNEDLCDIIDLRILHNIYQNKNKKYIFLCVGETHVENINKTLRKLDYKTKLIFSSDILTPLNLNQIFKNLFK